jgi:hypothetical protein
MNDLICISSIVIAIKLSDWTPNSWMWITKSITCSQLLTGTIWSINAKLRSHVKFGLLWLDCDSQIRTKLANLWGIFDQILKNDLCDARSFCFKKESFWFQKSSPWCTAKIKNSNTDKSIKINLHNKKREELISAPAVLVHFVAGAWSTI